MANLFRSAKAKYGDNTYDQLFENVEVVPLTVREDALKKAALGVKDFLNYFLINTTQYNNGALTEAEQYIFYWKMLNDK